MEKFVNLHNLEKAMAGFKNAVPFDHVVVDDFLAEECLEKIKDEFIGYDAPQWFSYKNQIEDKKALNDWNIFPKDTYQLFQHLNSERFVAALSRLTGVTLHSDLGLHGGGWHIHGVGGNLNPHLDYSIHPKLGLQRKLNLIIYVSEQLEEKHGGHLGFWSNDEVARQPDKLIKEIAPKFNRAVLFDTTQNSWHGMNRPLVQPEGIYRKSLAIYYLCKPAESADRRERALFAPREEQRNNKDIEDLIRMRADLNLSRFAYRKN